MLQPLDPFFTQLAFIMIDFVGVQQNMQQAMADEAVMSEFVFILCVVKCLLEGLTIVVIADQ